MVVAEASFGSFRFEAHGSEGPAGAWLLRFCREQPARALLYGLAAASFLFMAAPGLDLAVSRFFASAGGGFALGSDPVLLALRDVNRMQPALAAALLLGILLGHAARPGNACSMPAHRALWALSVYALSGGAVVHLLKNVMGRARPQAIAEFGGEAAFSAAWQLSGACARNCSFSSGEAASAVSLVALALLLPARLRPAGLLCAGGFALAASLNRVAFGSHFLSDVVVSWFLTALLALGLHRLCRAGAARIDAAVSGALAKAGTVRGLPRGRGAVLLPTAPARL